MERKNADREGKSEENGEKHPPLLPTGTDESEPQRQGFALPPLKKSLLSERQVARVGFRMCGCALSFGSESL